MFFVCLFLLLFLLLFVVVFFCFFFFCFFCFLLFFFFFVVVVVFRRVRTFVYRHDNIKSFSYIIRPRDYKTFFMLNSTEHEIFSANKYENANNSWHFHIY